MSTNEQVNVQTGELVPVGPVDTSMSVADLKRRLEVYDAVRTAAVERLKEGTDYGKPYDGAPKPCLLKPGAEKLSAFFGFCVEVITSERVDSGDYFECRSSCRISRGGSLIATGIGSCNSKERKYANQIEDGNTTVYDLKNTIEKMAGKRCFVDAILRATGLSDIYTQDLDENPELGKGHDRPSNQGMRAMKSKFENKCAGCGETIPVGADILWQAGDKDKNIKSKTYHPACVGKTPPEANGTAEKKPDIDDTAPATEKQIAVIDKLIDKRDAKAQAWWADVKETCIETVTQGRAGKIIQQLGALAPDAAIPEAEWNDMLAGGVK
jgi:hypothetical protein